MFMDQQELRRVGQVLAQCSTQQILDLLSWNTEAKICEDLDGKTVVYLPPDEDSEDEDD